MAGAGETALDVGRRRAAREEGGFSYRNAVVADPGTGAVAALIGYPLPDRAAPIDLDIPSMIVPLQQLENLACGSWYVNVLAAYPEHRGRGDGARLLGLVERLAGAAGRRGLSVIVSGSNEGAALSGASGLPAHGGLDDGQGRPGRSRSRLALDGPPARAAGLTQAGRAGALPSLKVV